MYGSNLSTRTNKGLLGNEDILPWIHFYSMLTTVYIPVLKCTKN